MRTHTKQRKKEKKKRRRNESKSKVIRNKHSSLPEPPIEMAPTCGVVGFTSWNLKVFGRFFPNSKDHGSSITSKLQKPLFPNSLWPDRKTPLL